MTVLVRVVYEDSRTGDDPFALHELVLQLVADVSEHQLWDLRRLVSANPRGPNSQVLKSLATIDGAFVIGVLDNDKIRSQPSVRSELERADVPPVTATCGDVARAAWAFAGEPAQSVVVLLRENAETVVEAVASCFPQLDPLILDRARRKKTDARDIVFQKAAFSGPGTRRCILGKVPSLALLRDRILCELNRRAA